MIYDLDAISSNVSSLCLDECAILTNIIVLEDCSDQARRYYSGTACVGFMERVEGRSLHFA
jgi:hypothetical protein